MRTGRAVPIEGQLRSHRLFSESIELYASLVDKASIYCTTSLGEPAEVKSPSFSALFALFSEFF